MLQGTGIQILSLLILVLLAVCQVCSLRMKNAPAKDSEVRAILTSVLVIAISRCLFNLVFIYSTVFDFSELLLKCIFQLNITSVVLIFSGELLLIRTARIKVSQLEKETFLKFVLIAMGILIFLNVVLNASIFFSDYYVRIENGLYVFGHGRRVSDISLSIMLLLILITLIVLRKHFTRLEYWVFLGFICVPIIACALCSHSIRNVEADPYTISIDISLLLVFIGQFLSHNKIIASTTEEKLEKENELNFVLSDQDLLTQAFSKLVLYAYRVNIQQNHYRELKTTDWFCNLIGRDGNPILALSRWLEQGIDKESFKQMKAFINLSTLPERMKNKDILSIDLKSSVTGSWLRLYIICVRRLPDGDANDTLWVVQSISEEKEREEKIKEAQYKIYEASWRAEHDALTGLYNRAGFDRITQTFAEEGKPLGLVLIDVDDFKKVNDTYGHDGGDKVLKLVGDALRTNFSPKDFFFRFGGDEFAVILSYYNPEMTGFIKDRMKRINEQLGDCRDETIPKVSVSSGAAFSESGYSEDLFKKADNALYEVKRAGKGGCNY